MKLANTFSIGEDSYVLLPWVIEGQLMGSKTKDLEIGDPGVESTDKSREVDDDDVKGPEEKSQPGL